MSVEQRTQSIVVGAIGGIFPIPAVTTIVTVLLCTGLRLSAAQTAVATAINLACTPLQLALLPSLGWIAASVAGTDASTFTAENIGISMREGLMPFLSSMALLLVHAVASWICIAITVVLVTLTLRTSEKSNRQ